MMQSGLSLAFALGCWVPAAFAQTSLSSVPVSPPPSPVALLGGVRLGPMVLPAIEGQPYVLTSRTTHTRTAPDGTTPVTVREVRKWRDAEGRTRDETINTKAGSWPNITDPVAQTIVHLSGPLKTADVTRVPLPAPAKPLTPEQEAQRENTRAGFAQYRRTHPKLPDAEIELPPRTIAGVYATGKRRVLTMKQTRDGVTQEFRVVEETWRSPELQITLEETTDDPRPANGKIVMVVTDLKRVDPDPSLFQIPADYKVTELR